MEILDYFQYNSIVILSYLGISFLAFLLNVVTKGKSNQLLFSCYRSSLLHPLTYLRLVTHSIGHADWHHFTSNFLYILLIGPMIEEKYGSIPLLIMILITSFVIGVLNTIFSKKGILGASGIVFMLIVLSSFVNIQNGKIPITLLFICLFYIVDEILKGIFKKDNVSHFGHLIGALCGGVFGYLSMFH